MVAILSPEVKNNLFCFLGVQNEAFLLAPDLQILHLLPTGCIIVVGDAAYDDVSSANIIIVLKG